MAALTAGLITGLRAAAIADALAVLEDELAAKAQTRVLRRAGDQTLSQLRAALTRAVIWADPVGAAQRAKEAKVARGVVLRNLKDAMAEISAVLPVAQAKLVMEELTARAYALRAELRAGPHDPELDGPDRPGWDGAGISALRADELIRAILGDTWAGHPDTWDTIEGDAGDGSDAANPRRAGTPGTPGNLATSRRPAAHGDTNRDGQGDDAAEAGVDEERDAGDHPSAGADGEAGDAGDAGANGEGRNGEGRRSSWPGTCTTTGCWTPSAGRRSPRSADHPARGPTTTSNATASWATAPPCVSSPTAWSGSCTAA